MQDILKLNKQQSQQGTKRNYFIRSIKKSPITKYALSKEIRLTENIQTFKRLRLKQWDGSTYSCGV